MDLTLLPLIALGVSVLGFLTGGISLTWQIVRHYRDTARLQVRLDHVVLAPQAGTFSRENGRLSLAGLADAAARNQSLIPPAFFELARVTIENPSKNSMSFIGPSFKISGTGRKKHSATLPAYDLADPLALPESGDVTRIEPFGIAEFYFDFRQGFAELVRQHPGLAIRAQVRVAGKRRFARSRWRLRWRLVELAESIREDRRVDAETVIFQTIVRSRGGFLTDEAPNIWLVVQVARKLSGRIREHLGDPRALSAEIKRVADDQGLDGVQFGGLFIALESALEQAGERVVWPTQNAPQFRLISELGPRREGLDAATSARVRDGGGTEPKATTERRKAAKDDEAMD